MSDKERIVQVLEDQIALCNEDRNWVTFTKDDAVRIVDLIIHPTIQVSRWKQLHGYATPGGTPLYVCGTCGGSQHLHGAEYPKIKLICDSCGAVNIYPWEQLYDIEGVTV